MNIEERQSIERKVVRHLFKTMKQHGWYVCNVWDGETLTHVTGCKEAMALIFNLDECQVRFEKAGRRHSVYLVLGNDGYDVVADYGYSQDDADGFAAIMEGPVAGYADQLAECC